MQDNDDCRTLRGGAWYLKRPSSGGHDANCLIEDVRPQFGFRLTRDNVDRVRRGGGWRADPLRARVAYRNDDDPGNRVVNLGLRLCADWSEE